VKRETDLYSVEEKKLLSVAPGITDLASIVFSDENEILKDSGDPDIDYNQLIRPWKSRLGIIYVEHRSFFLDCHLIWLTVLAMINREWALAGVHRILIHLGAPEDVTQTAQRQAPLTPACPPGMNCIVTHR
jgi:lipopolysaccharide/colanic/teichoic acid biosynthesis glycosyltransferase